jgi:tripartite-type tricarboxylate transporter receptor subunit TctC
LPNLPTVEEAGGPANFEVRTWTAIFAPRGTPPEIIKQLNTDITAQVLQPDMVKAIRDFGFETTTETVDQLTSIIRQDTEKYREIVKLVGLKAE